MKTRLSIKLLLLIGSLILFAAQITADEDKDAQDSGDGGNVEQRTELEPTEEPDGVDPVDCISEKFLTLNTTMTEQGITDPDEMRPVQELFAKCKTFLKNEVFRAVNRMTDDQKASIRKFVRTARGFEDGYEGTTMTLAALFEEKVGKDLQKALKNEALFDKYFDDMLHELMAPFQGTLLEQAQIYRIVFGPLEDFKQAETVAKKFYDRTDPKTLEWVTYAIIIENFVEGEDVLADELWYYFKDKNSILNWGPLKLFKKCAGQ